MLILYIYNHTGTYSIETAKIARDNIIIITAILYTEHNAVV